MATASKTAAKTVSRTAAKPAANDGRRSIQSIEVGAPLLAALVEAGKPLTLRDLAAGAGMTSAKAHPYLVSFVRVGLVQQDPLTGQYELGPFALQMGLVNKVVPLEQLEETTIEWCRKIQAKSPLAIRMLKSSFNAELDGQAGIQELAGNATLLYYLSDEAKEGKNAFLEKRKPDFSKFPKFP